MYKTWNSNIKYRNDHQCKMTNLILWFLCFKCANSPPGTDQTGFKGYHHQMIKRSWVDLTQILTRTMAKDIFQF